MEKAKTGIKKTCLICGLSKPLATFLQLGGPKGSFSSNVCATCRASKSSKNSQPNSQQDDDRTTTSSGLQIDTKTRVKSESDKIKHRKELDENYREDHLKHITNQEKQTEKQQTILEDGKKHRTSFFDKSNKQIASKNTSKKSPGFYEKTDLSNKQLFNTEENIKLEKVAEYEHQIKTIDTTGPFIPSQTGRLQKYGEVFNAFIARNASSPIAKAFGLILKQADLDKQKPTDKTTIADELKNRFGKKR